MTPHNISLVKTSWQQVLPISDSAERRMKAAWWKMGGHTMPRCR